MTRRQFLFGPTGTCSVCGRPLSDPESVAAGIGPIYAQKEGHDMNELATYIPKITSIEDLSRLSKMFFESGFFKDAASAAQCGVKILAGAELGFPSFASMTGIHIIQGKPEIGAHLLAAAVKRSGKYDYRVKQMDDKACIIAFYEAGQEIGESGFALEDAKKAGTKNLDKFPRNMFFARAISNGVRWYCPDITLGPVYTPEGLGGEVLESEAGGEAVDAEFAAEPEPITPAQIKALAILLKEAGFGTDETQKQVGRDFVAHLAHRDHLGSIKELTKAEARAILDRLGTGENGNYHSDKEKVQAELNAWAESKAEPPAPPREEESFTF